MNTSTLSQRLLILFVPAQSGEDKLQKARFITFSLNFSLFGIDPGPNVTQPASHASVDWPFVDVAQDEGG